MASFLSARFRLAQMGYRKKYSLISSLSIRYVSGLRHYWLFAFVELVWQVGTHISNKRILLQKSTYSRIDVQFRFVNLTSVFLNHINRFNLPWDLLSQRQVQSIHFGQWILAHSVQSPLLYMLSNFENAQLLTYFNHKWNGEFLVCPLSVGSNEIQIKNTH